MYLTIEDFQKLAILIMISSKAYKEPCKPAHCNDKEFNGTQHGLFQLLDICER